MLMKLGKLATQLKTRILRSQSHRVLNLKATTDFDPIRPLCVFIIFQHILIKFYHFLKGFNLVPEKREIITKAQMPASSEAEPFQ